MLRSSVGPRFRQRPLYCERMTVPVAARTGAENRAHCRNFYIYSYTIWIG